MDNIDIYENSSIILLRKIPAKIVSWITLLIAAIIFIIIFTPYFKLKKHDNYIGIFKDDKILLLVEKNNINTIKNSFVLENKKYIFSIDSISQEYVIIDDKNYYEVVLNADLEDKYKINNNILNISIEREETTLFDEIIKFFKEGIR